MMNQLYSGSLRDYANYFQPAQKLLKKKRVGARVVKKYDTSKTPYQRVLESKEASKKDKEKLRTHYMNLNPVALRKEVEKGLEKLFSSVEKSYRTYEENVEMRVC